MSDGISRVHRLLWRSWMGGDYVYVGLLVLALIVLAHGLVRVNAAEQQGVGAAGVVPAVKVVPCVELNNSRPGNVAIVERGLAQWSRLTDTAIVSTTPGNEGLFPRLAGATGLRIIPGMKLSACVKHIDDPAGWLLFAQAVARVAEAAESGLVYLETESATGPYYRGEQTLDVLRFQRCLAHMPDNLTYLWYPAPSSSSPDVYDRQLRVAKLVAAELKVIWVDMSVNRPAMTTERWRAHRLKLEGRLHDLNAAYFFQRDRALWAKVYLYQAPWAWPTLGEALRWVHPANVAIVYPGFTGFDENSRRLVDGIIGAGCSLRRAKNP